MARVSISLPDELITRLEPIKERINISRVCREAIENRISIFEGAGVRQEDDLDLQSLIARLREERTMVEGKWENLAKRNAIGWLHTASLMEIRNAMEPKTSLSMAKYRLPRDAFRTMKQDMAEARESLEGAPAVVYKTAWLDHIRAIWAIVEPQILDVDGTPPAVKLERQTNDNADT